MDTQDDEEFTPFIPALWINEMDRTQAERVISNLYEVDSDVGRQLLHDLLDEWGLTALTDDAVIELARKHQEERRKTVLGD